MISEADLLFGFQCLPGFAVFKPMPIFMGKVFGLGKIQIQVVGLGTACSCSGVVVIAMLFR